MKRNKTFIIVFILILLWGIGVVLAGKKYQIYSVSRNLHNQGNIAMQEYFNGSQGNLLLAKEYYQDSLNILDDPRTLNNLMIVNKLLALTKKVEDENNDSSSGGIYNEDNSLSGEEKQQLNTALEEIKSQQEKNQKYYNKVQQGSSFQDTYDSFFGELDRGGEKDW
ncbi:hypothetical protein LR010_00845 [Candidatus Gracilibacteria bacterium]|nr:hypothetical protein [Candidatus Gracilibacteria bacterium]